MKKILVPTDFSDTAKNVLEYAVNIAVRLNAEILLLHIVQIPIAGQEMPVELANMLNESEKESRQEMRQMVQKIHKNTNGKVRCETMIKMGFTVSEIVAASADKNCDMIVMGTKGASGLTEILIGSNTASVIGKVKCPVLAVPEKSKFKNINKIVYTDDFKNPPLFADDLPVIIELLNFAKLFDAQLMIIHIHQKNEENINNKLDALFTQVKYHTDYEKISFQVVNNENIVRSIHNFSEKSKADVIALATYNRGLLQTLFHNSITKKIAYHTTIPLLAFHKATAK